MRTSIDRRPFAPPLSLPTEQERLHRAAVERAHELREEAIRGLWRAGVRRLAAAAGLAGRAVQWLAVRLRQHASPHGPAA